MTAAGLLAVPVLNLARSTVKTLLGYPEIADSCLRSLRALLPAHKVIGRPVTLLGYGALGSRLAHGLRCLGARVSIVDTDIRALVAAAEAGYPTRRTLTEAITADPPFLLAAATGEIALTRTDLPLLPDGLLLAPFATRDFSLLVDGDLAEQATQIPGSSSPPSPNAPAYAPGRASPLHLELASSILGPRILLDRGPVTTPGPWRRGLRPDDDRHRHLVLHAGRTRFTLHLDPVTAHGGWQLDRNHHRLTAERDGHLLHEDILIDSPLRTSVRQAVAALQADRPPRAPDLAPLRRIAAIADLLRAWQPHPSRTATAAAVAVNQ